MDSTLHAIVQTYLHHHEEDRLLGLLKNRVSAGFFKQT